MQLKPRGSDLQCYCTLVSAVGMAGPRRGVQSLQLGGLTPDRHLIDGPIIRKVLEGGKFWLEGYWFVVAGRKGEKAAFVFAKVCRIISPVLACSYDTKAADTTTRGCVAQ